MDIARRFNHHWAERSLAHVAPWLTIEGGHEDHTFRVHDLRRPGVVYIGASPLEACRAAGYDPTDAKYASFFEVEGAGA